MAVLTLQLANALVLCGQGFADAALPQLLGLELTEPAPDGGGAQTHVFADLRNAQALNFDHLDDLQFEAGVKDPSGFGMVHVSCRFSFDNLSLCLFKSDHHSLMRAHQLRSIWRRKFIHTTDSKHTMPVAANVLDRQFTKALPNQAWVSDITYIRTRSGWLYLAAVLDLHSRKIVGWAMAPQMPATLVCAALQMAIAQRNPEPGLVVHSDRGTQYASSLHQALLAHHGLIGSMSRKGNCWDNAVMERFFLNLKMERVWQKDYANHAEAITDIADYIVNFYNAVRLHSTLGNLSPIAFEHQSATKKLIELSEIT